MNRQILLVVVPGGASDNTAINSKDIMEAYRSFCVYGYKVTLATLDGAPLYLDAEAKTEYGTDFLSEGTVKVSDLTSDQLADYCAMYTILPSRVNTLDELDELPGMEDTLFDFCCGNKLVIIQHNEGYQFLNPREIPAEISTFADAMGCIASDMDIKSFVQLVMVFTSKLLQDLSASEGSFSELLHADLAPHAIAS